uniref:cytochrome P450 18a1-like n=1 Tax=Styela clava TaxID=7725 RepID=UPI0019393C80|nr:cytochrome P450 18a1-like [Styela clava]
MMSYCGYLSMFPPFTGAMRRYAEDFDHLRDLCMDRIKEHQRTYVKGEIRDFIDIFIEEMKKEDHDETFREDQLALLLRDFLDAGSQAVSFTLEWCMIILAKKPEYQKKIREESDAIVGQNNPVVMTHRDKMPFTQAFIFEVMRTCTIVALSHVCAVEEGVQVNGYTLPKNTPILSVTSAVHNDPRYFKKPKEFRPERFINPTDGSFQKSKYWMPFSLGRRSCAGYQMAHVEIFVILVNLVRSFDIAADDEKNIPNLNDGEHGVLYLPPPFEMRATERVDGNC